MPQRLVSILQRINPHEDARALKAGHALLDAMNLGVGAFYAYKETIVHREESIEDLSKTLVTILHAFKNNPAVVMATLEVFLRLFKPSGAGPTARDVHWRRQCGEAGLCAALVQLGEAHLQDAVVVEHVLDLMAYLTLERENKVALGEKVRWVGGWVGEGWTQHPSSISLFLSLAHLSHSTGRLRVCLPGPGGPQGTACARQQGVECSDLSVRGGGHQHQAVWGGGGLRSGVSGDERLCLFKRSEPARLSGRSSSLSSLSLLSFRLRINSWPLSCSSYFPPPTSPFHTF